MSMLENMKQIIDLASQIVKEESSAVNPILPQYNMSINKGWQCPICGRVYSPTTPMCFYCKGNSQSIPTTININTQSNSNKSETNAKEHRMY